MKFKEYLKDKVYAIILTLLTVGVIYLIFRAYRIKTSIIISGIIIFLICNVIIMLIEYFRKRNFYNEFLTNILELDKSYLVLETLDCPEFCEGKLLYQALYEINKSYLENVNKIDTSRKNFKEYVEMWIHEVKIPLATLTLTINNHQNEINPKIKSQIKRLEDYVDQVLYYVRSENAEKDYLISKINDQGKPVWHDAYLSPISVLGDWIFKQIITRYRECSNLHELPISPSFKILAYDHQVSDLNSFLQMKDLDFKESFRYLANYAPDSIIAYLCQFAIEDYFQVKNNVSIEKIKRKLNKKGGNK